LALDEFCWVGCGEVKEEAMDQELQHKYDALKEKLGRTPKTLEFAAECGKSYFWAYTQLKAAGLLRPRGKASGKPGRKPGRARRAGRSLAVRQERGAEQPIAGPAGIRMKAATDKFLQEIAGSCRDLLEEQAKGIQQTTMQGLHAVMEQMEARAGRGLCVVCGEKPVTRIGQLICDACTAHKRMTGRSAAKV